MEIKTLILHIGGPHYSYKGKAKVLNGKYIPIEGERWHLPEGGWLDIESIEVNVIRTEDNYGEGRGIYKIFYISEEDIEVGDLVVRYEGTWGKFDIGSCGIVISMPEKSSLRFDEDYIYSSSRFYKLIEEECYSIVKKDRSVLLYEEEYSKYDDDYYKIPKKKKIKLFE